MKVLIFSCKRPLQLEANLRSLLLLGNINPGDVTVLLPRVDDDYFKIVGPLGVHSLEEEYYGGFDLTLREYFRCVKDDEPIMFNCDDVIWKAPFSTKLPEKILQNKDILGFSLRLGVNIKPYPYKGFIGTKFQSKYYDKTHLLWQWIGEVSHYGYPFELMASIYRASLVKEILNDTKTQMTIPNDLESLGVQYCYKNKLSQPFMAMFNTDSYAVAQDLNVVQCSYKNKHGGTEEQNSENLLLRFREGYHLNWTTLFNTNDHDVFVGNKYFELEK